MIDIAQRVSTLEARMNDVIQSEARLEKRIDRDTTTRRWLAGLAFAAGLAAFGYFWAWADTMTRRQSEATAEIKESLAEIRAELRVTKEYMRTRRASDPDPMGSQGPVIDGRGGTRQAMQEQSLW